MNLFILRWKIHKFVDMSQESICNPVNDSTSITLMYSQAQVLFPGRVIQKILKMEPTAVVSNGVGK